MSLETATFINQLIEANPSGADQYSTADDHLRLIKHVLINQFPSLTAAVTSDATELNKLDGVTATTAELNKLAGVTATATELSFVHGVTSAIQTQINAREQTANKNAANGYCGLDGSALIPLTRIPTTLTGKSADQLDGQSGSFYQNAGNLNAGTLPDARVAPSNVTQHQAALAINAEQVSTQVQTKTGSFSIDASMDEDIVRCNSVGTINITLDAGVIPIGHSIYFEKQGTGAVNFLAGASQIIRTPNGTSILAQYGKAAATYIANNNWSLGGLV